MQKNTSIKSRISKRVVLSTKLLSDIKAIVRGLVLQVSLHVLPAPVWLRGFSRVALLKVAALLQVW